MNHHLWRGVGLLMLSVPMTSWASTALTGQVDKLEFGPSYRGVVVVDLRGESDALCADNPNGFDFAFDASTDAGKLVFSALLAAQRQSLCWGRAFVH
ncbi:hypothetical protein QNZ87_004252 [Vibrio parahaemolyticus]|nr:hypothetical protein [Vibrio parahaemolyticus]